MPVCVGLRPDLCWRSLRSAARRLACAVVVARLCGYQRTAVSQCLSMQTLVSAPSVGCGFALAALARTTTTVSVFPRELLGRRASNVDFLAPFASSLCVSLSRPSFVCRRRHSIKSVNCPLDGGSSSDARNSSKNYCPHTHTNTRRHSARRIELARSPGLR